MDTKKDNSSFEINGMLLVSLIVSVGIVGCSDAPMDESASDAPVHVAAIPADSPKPIGFGPLTYFDISCARCHGPNGASYGDAFGADLSDEELIQFVDDMAAGPGGAPLEPEELKAQVAFHRSLIDKRPFVIVTERTENAIKGEIMPGSKVTLDIDGESTTATVAAHQWECKLPNTAQSIKIVAERNNKTTEIDLNKQTYSHTKPEEQM